MLAKLGSRWDDWRALELDKLLTEDGAGVKGDVARLIEEQYGKATIFVLNDPRISDTGLC